MSCKKKTFQSKEDALQRVREIKYDSFAIRQPQRAYKCKLCGKWHLTSSEFVEQDKEEQKKKDWIHNEVEYWSKRKNLRKDENN